MTTHILKNPRITEKASINFDNNVYTFQVSSRANKAEIKKAVFQMYKVKPIRVNILPIPHKTVKAKGKIGSNGGGKKAYVYLKKGDKIEFV